MLGHVPMCKVCGEWEVGTFTGSTEFCSENCWADATEFLTEASKQWEQEREQYMAMYDDDPNPYAGTYSEE